LDPKSKFRRTWAPCTSGAVAIILRQSLWNKSCSAKLKHFFQNSNETIQNGEEFNPSDNFLEEKLKLNGPITRARKIESKEFPMA
jgi:hypothetical protein